MTRYELAALIYRSGLHSVIDAYKIARFARDVAMHERNEILRECQHAYSLAHCLELIRDRHYPLEDVHD